MKIHLLSGAVLGFSGLLLTTLPVAAQTGGKATVSVEKIHAKPTLQQSMDRAGKGASLGRVTEAFDSQLIDRLHSSRKLTVLAVSDLADILKAANRSGQASEGVEHTYGLVATLDDFEDSTERMEFKTLNQVGLKRKIRLSIVAKIWNVKTGELYESANIQVLKKDDRSDSTALQKNAELTDELLLAGVQEAAQKLVDRVVEVAFPTKVIAKSDNQITINRGDSAGVEIGQVWNVFSGGKTLIDPDTGEVLGREELLAGQARVVSVQPKFSTATILTGGDKISEGMVLRLPQTR